MSVESTTREVRSPGPAAAAAGLVAALLSHVREEKRSRGGASGLSSVVCTDPVAPSAFSPRFVGEPSVRGLAPSVHRSPWGLRDAPAGPRVDRGPGRGLPRPSRRGACRQPVCPRHSLRGGQRPALTPPRSAARRSRHPQTQWEPLGQAPGPDRLGWRDQRASRRAWLGPQRRGRTGLPTKSAD